MSRARARQIQGSRFPCGNRHPLGSTAVATHDEALSAYRASESDEPHVIGRSPSASSTATLSVPLSGARQTTAVPADVPGSAPKVPEATSRPSSRSRTLPARAVSPAFWTVATTRAASTVTALTATLLRAVVLAHVSDVERPPCRKRRGALPSQPARCKLLTITSRPASTGGQVGHLFQDRRVPQIRAKPGRAWPVPHAGAARHRQDIRAHRTPRRQCAHHQPPRCRCVPQRHERRSWRADAEGPIDCHHAQRPGPLHIGPGTPRRAHRSAATRAASSRTFV